MPTTLEQILAAAGTRIAALRARAAELARGAAAAQAPRPFPPVPPGGGDAGGVVGVLAEVKRRSPTQGVIHDNLDAVAHALAYERGGAAAVSVLTDAPHFGGSIDDLRRVTAAVRVPVLRKDFILDELQIIEARAAGASAVLLIVRVLAAGRLAALASAARSVGLATLVEVHTRAELDVALAADPPPDAVGVNARDLATFTLDPLGAAALIAAVPAGVPVVAESGIESRADVERFAAAGADFVLVGTSVARAMDPEGAVRALTGVARRGR